MAHFRPRAGVDKSYHNYSMDVWMSRMSGWMSRACPAGYPLDIQDVLDVLDVLDVHYSTIKGSSQSRIQMSDWNYSTGS
mgnify:CR=1 FL=1